MDADVKASLEKLNKKLGAGTIAPMSEIYLDLPRISSGIFGVDKILGGGFPQSSVIEVSGIEMAGKSTLALGLCAEVQNLGLDAAYIDLENGLNRDLVEKCDVDYDNLILSQPGTAEEVLEIMDELVRAKIGLVVVDSVAQMTPAAEIAGDFGDAHVGVAARVIGLGVRKITSTINTTKSPTIILMINQIRETIGGFGYGPKTTTPGGRSLKHKYDIRLEVSRIGQLKNGDDVIGHKMKVKTTKNRTAPPFQEVVLELYYDSGVSKSGSVLDYALDLGLVLQKGAWFSDTETAEKLGQGRAKVLEYLETDLQYATDLEARVKELIYGSV